MIRKLQKDDFESVKRLLQEVHLFHLNNRQDIFKNGDVLSQEYFDILLNNANGINLVFEEKNMIKGLVFSSILEKGNNPIMNKRRVLYIDNLVVDKNFRKQHIGSNLLKELENFAKNYDIDSIELNVWAFNKDAINFYEKMFFKTKSLILEKRIK